MRWARARGEGEVARQRRGRILVARDCERAAVQREFAVALKGRDPHVLGQRRRAK